MNCLFAKKTITRLFLNKKMQLRGSTDRFSPQSSPREFSNRDPDVLSIGSMPNDYRGMSYDPNKQNILYA